MAEGKSASGVGMVLQSTCRLHGKPGCQESNWATHRLDSMQRGSMPPHSTPNDYKVVVIVFLGLGHSAQTSADAVLGRPVSKTGLVVTQVPHN